jgi:N utilization substance protein A
VPDYQLSLAIGKDGQNARLAARLTQWRIDIHPDNPVAQIKAENTDQVPIISPTEGA